MAEKLSKEMKTALTALKKEKVRLKPLRARLSALELAINGTKADLIKRMIAHTKNQLSSGDLKIEDCGQCDVCLGYSDLNYPECPYCGDGETESEKNEELDSKTKEADETKEKNNSDKKEPKEAKKKKRSEVNKESTDIVKYSETDLDKAIENISSHSTKSAVEIYNIGKELKMIHDLSLWKLREGNPYGSFIQFLKAEVNLSRAHVYRLMEVASEYKLEAFEKFGFYKCKLALKVPDEARTKLLGDGKGESRENISARAKELMEQEKDARKTAPVSDRNKAVTVAIVPGIVEVTMQKRPTDDDWPTGKLTEPAVSMTDEPWFRIGLTNNVFLTVKLALNDEGHIIAIVEHRRSEESA